MPQQHGLRGAVDEIPEDHEVERLLDEVVRPALERGLRGRHVAVGGDEDRRRVGLVFLHESEDVEPGLLVLHDQIGHDHVEGTVHDLVPGGFESVDDGADMAGLPQRLGHDLGVLGLVVDDEDLSPHRPGVRGIGDVSAHGDDCTRPGTGAPAH